MKALQTVLALFALGAAESAPADWLDGTVLADCEYCRTDAFATQRKHIANQLGRKHDPASGTGYVVTIDAAGRHVWGRAALVGTGTLLRTDAHVLFSDSGELKTGDGKIYFEPMQHGGASLIEIDRSTLQRGGAVGPLEIDVKNDWAIARLREDAIEKLGGERVFAFLWDIRITHDDIVTHDYMRDSVLVLSPERTLAIEHWCHRVIDDHPSRYAFGVDEIFFIRCPSKHVQAGTSGSALAIRSRDGTWNLGGQLVAAGTRQGAGDAASESAALQSPEQQVFLGNAPMLREMLAIAYLQELIRRGLDPLDR